VFVAEFEIRLPGTEAKLLIKSRKFILMQNRKSQAGAKTDSSTQDEATQYVRRHNTNTIVSGSFLQEIEIAYRFAKENLDVAWGSKVSNPDKYNLALETFNSVKEKRREAIDQWIVQNCR